MPFKSRAQQRFMFAKHPKIAERWAKLTRDFKALPEKVDGEENASKEATVSEQSAMSFEEKVINAVELSGAALTRAEEAMQKQAVQQAQVEALIPEVVEALIANGKIEPIEKAAAEEALKDPTKALQILAKTAAHKSDAEAAALGTQADQNGQTKQASNGQTSLNSPYVGGRHDGPKASDLALLRGLGLS